MRPELAMDWAPAGGITCTAAFVPCEYFIKPVTEDWEREAAMALRRNVFCAEQRLFGHDDRDILDRTATLLVAVACISGMPDTIVGTVRIHESSPGHWQGSRLAVHHDYRRVALLGSELIRLAVGLAHARGAHRFTAQVQTQNVPLFRRLHWQTLEKIELFGRPHHRMQADLSKYPPCLNSDGFIARRAA